jgi:hypothetical protein
MSRIGEVALTVAILRPDRAGAISPNVSPGPRVAMRTPSRRISAVPSSIALLVLAAQPEGSLLLTHLESLPPQLLQPMLRTGAHGVQVVDRLPFAIGSTRVDRTDRGLATFLPERNQRWMDTGSAGGLACRCCFTLHRSEGPRPAFGSPGPLRSAHDCRRIAGCRSSPAVVSGHELVARRSPPCPTARPPGAPR